MEKIITAKEQWMNAMNDLRNEGYECDACCDGLGAIGENEFYQVYDKRHTYFFETNGKTYKMYDCTDLTPEYVLANGWKNLDMRQDWWDKEAVMEFLIEYGRDCYQIQPTCPLSLCDMIWMGVYPENEGILTEFWDNKVEVTTEEIEDIRKEITERCKGHSIEEVRDMFQGYNWGEYGEDTFDFEYKGFVFCIGNQCDDCNPNEPYSLFLSTCVCSEDGETREDFGSTINLPIPPKEIKVDVEPTPAEKPDLTDWGMTISYDYIVERMRECCIARISDIYQKIGKPFVKLDLAEWRHEEHCYFAEYDEGYAVALTKNYEGNVVIAGCSVYDVNPEWCINKNWSFVSLEEMLHIINQLTSK